MLGQVSSRYDIDNPERVFQHFALANVLNPSKSSLNVPPVSLQVILTCYRGGYLSVRRLNLT